ncbi:formylglycine-generating enzyme family protein [Sorangium sp. So ce362]|uniref:formylglycine-generating enzyme family protein n=1 Tax=Sorangium sp. So ce362 TaxID=3133303 RepID=UPI003F6237D6
MRRKSRGQGTWVGVIVAVVLAGSCAAACGADPEDDPPGEGGSGGAGGGGAGGDATGGGGAGTGGEGAGAPAGPRSCGSGELASEVLCGSESISCCDSRLVPGGTSQQTTVSSLLLDTYEVTVGRFRAFVEAGQGTRASAPEADAGQLPKIPGSGWSADWKGWLEEDTAALKAALRCRSEYERPTWTDEVGPNEDLPINCITWPEAFAFCVWDGGRLPTTAELNYAAAGGDEEREYPWGEGLDPSYASYACSGDGSPAGECAQSDILPVGSKPAGAGRWGQQDLSGNMTEFTRDWSGQLPVPCVDCAILEQPGEGAYLLTHGGNYLQAEEHQHATRTGIYRSPGREEGVGVRCARNPPPAE